MGSLEDAISEANSDLSTAEMDFDHIADKLRGMKGKGRNDEAYGRLLAQIRDYEHYSKTYGFLTTDDEGNDCTSSVDVLGHRIYEGFNGCTAIPVYYMNNPFIERLQVLFKDLCEDDLLLQLESKYKLTRLMAVIQEPGHGLINDQDDRRYGFVEKEPYESSRPKSCGNAWFDGGDGSWWVDENGNEHSY